MSLPGHRIQILGKTEIFKGEKLLSASSFTSTLKCMVSFFHIYIYIWLKSEFVMVLT